MSRDLIFDHRVFCPKRRVSCSHEYWSLGIHESYLGFVVVVVFGG